MCFIRKNPAAIPYQGNYQPWNALSTGGYILPHLCSCCRNAATYKWKFLYRYAFFSNMMFGSSLHPVVCRKAHVFKTLIYVICVCLRIALTNTYCVVFLFYFSSSSSYHRLPVSLDYTFLIALWYSLTFIYPMLPVSLDYSFLNAPSVFSNVYLPNVASFSGLFIFDCSFGIL